MKTVEIRWTEVSQHRMTVNVPDDFDADKHDLANDLAEFDGDGFCGLEREDVLVTETDFEPEATQWRIPAGV
ncbi:hypothetical protein SEA_VANLEE_145 [Gordonia phage VanLee]|uniref:Uncharacterized protein n=1 Tax=Gordonia phage VanLee TaxID=2845816 RepID=A0A8F2IFI5_9CAUD|nr:hypothetical protein QEH49_gp145 [Gordonia phage VanLee]QWS68261.1 hypothetical protein SEA_VANLEE_145 [Gordonia phage VanLee]